MKLKSQDTHSLFVEGVPASKRTNKQNETFFGDSLEKIISDFKGVLVPMAVQCSHVHNLEYPITIIVWKEKIL